MEPQKQTKDTISLFDIIVIFIKNWKLIFFSTLITVVLIFGYAFYTKEADENAAFNYLPNVYKPYVVVRLQDQSEESSASILASNSSIKNLVGLSGMATNQGSNVALAKELITGKTIVDKITTKFKYEEKYGLRENVKTAARRIFTNSLNLDFNEKAGTLTISYQAIDSKFATNVLNYSLLLLEERFRELTMQKVNSKKRFLQERLEEVQKELESAKTTLINYQAEQGIVDVVSTESGDGSRTNTEFVFSSYISWENRQRIQLRYEELLRDKKILDNLYGMLMEQYERVKIEEMDDSKTFQVLERAEIPEVKAGPQRLKVIVIVTVVTFALSVLLAFFLEYLEWLRKDPIEGKKLKQIKEALYK